MPLSALNAYIISKYKHELEREAYENYIADCLWVTAIGRNFIKGNKDRTPTLKRWSEINGSNPEKTAETDKGSQGLTTKITKEDIKSRLRGLLDI